MSSLLYSGKTFSVQCELIALVILSRLRLTRLSEGKMANRLLRSAFMRTFCIVIDIDPLHRCMSKPSG